MKLTKLIICSLFLSSSTIFLGCNQEGGKKGSPNAPEIVNRDADTVFNYVPEKDHSGMDAYAEAGESGNLFRTMSQADSFSRFSDAVNKAGLRDLLTSNEQFTVFAPTDQAFSKIPQEKINELFRPENKQKLVDLVFSHIVKGNIRQKDLSDGRALKTLNVKTINIKMVDGRPTINSTPVVEQGQQPENGALYALEQVLMP
ncbi:MAG: fasciclin domain-containing protein [Bacteroidota bacterium]|nr:fasciclin domain-containing protein [Bacteroidota bacterium]